MTDTSGTTPDNREEIVVTGKKKPATTTLPSNLGHSIPWSITLLVGQQPFPLSAFDVESGAYGSVGHGTFTTSVKILKQLGISIPTVTSQASGSTPVDLYVTDTSGTKIHLFGGEYVAGDWDYDTEVVTISARDGAGVLVDQKRALTALLKEIGLGTPDAPGEDAGDTSGISTVNVPIETVVKNVCSMFGLTPVLNLAPGDNTVNIGSQYNGESDTVLSSRPQTLWGFLNILARDSGNEVYVDPDKNLVFGIPGANTPIPLLSLSYMINPVPSDSMPIRRAKVTHNIRRNSSFRVLVLSYNPATAQVTQGEAYVLGDGITADGEQQISPGVWSGNDAQLISKSLQGQDQKFPIYTFHIDGLTAQQAQTRATAIATDIAKREFIVTCQADLIPKVRPMNQTKLAGGLDPIFLGQNYYVNRYRHTYKMPSTHGGGGGGMLTDLTLLNIKQQGTGSPLTKKASNK